MNENLQLIQAVDFAPKLFSEGDMHDRSLAQQRIQNPIAPNLVDIIPDALFDTVSYAAAASMPASIDFFVTAKGQSGKTYAQTNMDQSQRLNDPQRFNMTHIGVQFLNTIEADIIGIDLAYSFSLNLTDKPFFGPLPVSLAPSGLGTVTTFGTQTAAATNQAASLGMNRGAYTCMWDLRLPQGYDLGNGQVADGITGVTLLQGQTFNCKLNTPNSAGYTLTAAGSGGKGTTIRVLILGVRNRAVL